MRTITLVRKEADTSSLVTSSAIAYETELEVTSATDMPIELFVKQRKQKVNIDSPRFVEDYTDDFVAVCQAEQLESLPAYVPDDPLGYFRDNKVTMRYTNPAVIEERFDSILAELQILIENLDALDTLTTQNTYTITATNVEIN